MSELTSSAAWTALVAHQRMLREASLRDLFASDPGRAARYTTEVAGLTLDWSKHLITDQTLELLRALADHAQVAT